MRLLLSCVVLFLASRGANAACVISGVRPTVALPTMAAGQEFSFLATADCEKLRFRVPGTTFVEIPKGGPDTGARLRTYKVVLTESEWDSLVDESDTTFTWSIIGTTSAGVTTRVTTTNELKDEGDVTIDLSMADAKLVGLEEYDETGLCVSGAGDVDGDGNADMLFGANRDFEGAAFLVRGPVTGTIDISMADATFVSDEPDGTGESVSGAGDVDGNGHDDLLVGAPYDDEGGGSAGAAYVVLGPVTGSLDLAVADAKLVGEARSDLAGASISGAGDVDGDGRADMLVGAQNNSEGAGYAGAAYLVLGPSTGTLDLSGADAKLVGEGTFDQAGYRVSGARDVDGNGHDDLLVGALSDDDGGGDAGAAYLVLGPVTGTLDLSLADAKFVGEGSGDEAAHVAGAGDVDGDGHNDVLIGAARGGTDRSGAAYLILGPVTGTLGLSSADAKLLGEGERERAGYSVSGAGDVDSDGFDDLLIGAYGNAEGGSDAGAAYVVLSPVTGTVDLSQADVKLVGEDSWHYAGISVAGGGDVDADGHDDLLVGAARGAVYLVYGGGL